MTIEDVAEKADAWSEAIKKIIKSITAACIALVTAIAALLTWWPSSSNETPVTEPLLQGTGYGPQCSQLYNTIDINWTESQWVVWEGLKRDMDC